jgi:membrane-bound ClpP family serine protease
MRIGGAILLLAVGAILTFAINVNHSHGFSINTIGIILMVVGGIWLVAELFVYGRRQRTDVVQAPPTRTTEYRY